MAKPKLLETLNEFRRLGKQAREQARLEIAPPTRRLRAAFSRLMEPYELMKITKQCSMSLGVPEQDIFQEITCDEGARMFMASVLRASLHSAKIVENIEEAAAACGLAVDIAVISRKEAAALPGFPDFIRECRIRRIIALKAAGKAAESRPILFSTCTGLAQKKDHILEFMYDASREFSEVFSGLALR